MQRLVTQTWILKSAEHTRGPVAAVRLFCVATASNQAGIAITSRMTEKVKTKPGTAEAPILISSRTGTVSWGITVVETHANESGNWPPVQVHAEGKDSFPFRHDSNCTV